jgi:hypothetical protein
MNLILAIWSLAMLITYAVYTFRFDWTNQCIARYSQFEPLGYNDESEIKALLESPGTENMSVAYHRVLMFGMITNLVSVVYRVMKMRLSEQALVKYQATAMLTSVATYIACAAQFVMLLTTRFSHNGEVCAGDNIYLMLKTDADIKKVQDDATDKDFTKYFLTSEGSLLYIYSLVILIMVCVVVFCVVCCGTCVYMQGFLS